MVRQELTIPCYYGYRNSQSKVTKTSMYGYVYNNPQIFVYGKNLSDVKNKLITVIKKMKLPYKLKFTWKLE